MHRSKGFFEDDFDADLEDGAVVTEASPMTVEPRFCPEGMDPFDTVEWEERTAQIKDESGGVLFEQENCQIPRDWSALATNVVVSKFATW